IAGARASEFEFEHATDESQDYTKRKVSPTVAAVWKVTPATNLYAGYLEGMEDGGIARPTAINAGTSLEPLVTRQWEGGVKTEWGGV
ncbi:TonB-dependent receptor, partial [Acinetobacter baumannii]